MIKKFFSTLLDLAYPRFCIGCGRDLSTNHAVFLCEPCRAEVKISDREVCPRCGFPVGPHASSIGHCHNCRNRTLYFTWARGAAEYGGVTRELLHQLKFDRFQPAASVAGALLSDFVLSNDLHENIDLIIPVPLHWRRRVERGFNQSELIASRLGRATGVPVVSDVLRRRRYTLSQARLSRAQRLENLRGAFDVADKKRIHGQRLLVVDDIMTSGATAAECARTLKGAGAKDVCAVVVAR